MASSSAGTTIKEEPTDSSMEINLDALLDPDDTGIPELNAKRRKPSTPPRPPRPRPGQAPPQKPTYPCPHCPRVCTNQWALNRHIASHIDIFKRPQEASETAIPTTARHCPFCDRAFDLFADLKAHLNQHKTTGNRRLYNCELCSKVFYQPADLIRHQARYHDPSQIYTCKHCPGIIFADYTAFKRHQRTAHPAVAHYCPACSAVLPDQPNLDAHIYFRHNSTATEITFKKELVSGAGSTVTTRYCCPYCTYRNVQRVPMEVHIYEEHLGEAQKWFVEAMIAVGRRNGATSRGQGRLNSSSGTQVQEPSKPVESTVVIKEEPADEESDAVPMRSQEARVSESSEMIRSPPPTIKYEPQDEDEIPTPTDHNRLPFICKHCHPVLNYFPNQNSLTRHLKSAHGQTPIPDGPQIAHHCPLCPAILPALPELKIHIFFSHNPTASRYPIERDLKHPKNPQLWRCPLRCARRDREHFGIQRHVFSKHVEKQQKQIVEQIAVTAKRVTSEGIILPPKPQKPVIVANPLLEQEKPSASTSNTSNTTTKPKNWNERQPTRPVSPCLKRPLATATATDQSVAIPILVPLPTSTSTISKRAIFRAVRPPKYQCTQCGNRLPTNHELQVHIWHAHTKQVQRKKQPAPQIIETIPVTLVVPNELFSVVVSPKQEEEETEDTKEKLAELSRKLFKK